MYSCVKIISDGTPFDTMIDKFSNVTRTTGIQLKVHQNTAHDIRPTQTPPVTC
jgi:hypothetical protein